MLAQPLPGVRLIVTELHPGLYGPDGVAEVTSALAAQGFAPEPDGSRGATVVFRRATPG